MINTVVSKYEERASALKTKTLELLAENERLKDEVTRLKDKESLILNTLERAEKTAKNVQDDVMAQYELEVERLRKFSEKWNGYFKELKEKYPIYPTTVKAVEINDKFTELVENSDPKTIIDKLDQMLGDQDYEQKNKIDELAVTEKTNGFDINEVLYPGALKLEDICKELGLIEEE